MSNTVRCILLLNELLVLVIFTSSVDLTKISLQCPGEVTTNVIIFFMFTEIKIFERVVSK